MTRLFRLLLLLGTLFGLFAQQTAFAAQAHVASAPAAATSMSADCMEMMQGQKSLPAQKPCTGVFDCMAAMGCVSPVALDASPIPIADALSLGKPAYWPTISVLVGTNHTPEPDPPTILG
jgi:hypothetical protein